MHWVCKVLLHCFGEADCHQLGECLHDEGGPRRHHITTFNTAKFPNPYLVLFCTRLCWYRKWKKKGGVGQCVENIAKGLELRRRRGRQAQGAALHNQKVWCCTGYVISVKQMVLLRLSFARPPPTVVRGEVPAVLHGQ